MHEPDYDFLMERIDEILHLIDDDPDRPGLQETPHRVAKAWLTELFVGIHQDPFEHMKTFEEVETSDLVIVANLPLYSSCEHHMEAILGQVHIAYIPNGKVLGLSKFGRIVDVYARRLQIQERLTRQVAECLVSGLNPLGLIVIVEARHLCMERRGIQAAGTVTTTSAIRGVFEVDSDARSEALHLITGSKKALV